MGGVEVPESIASTGGSECGVEVGFLDRGSYRAAEGWDAVGRGEVCLFLFPYSEVVWGPLKRGVRVERALRNNVRREILGKDEKLELRAEGN